MAREALPPLWACPNCGARFVSANLWHSCGRFRVEDLFAKSEPHVFELYRRFKRMVERCGPVVEIPQKTRLVFMVRMRFAGFTVRKSGLRIGLILTRRLPADPRLVQVEPFGPHSIGHYFEITRQGQLDASMQRWIREAYDSGAQKGFERRGKSARRARGSGEDGVRQVSDPRKAPGGV